MGSRKRRWIRILHRPTGTPIAEGPVGWEITPFEGNFYIRRRRLLTDRFRPSWIPGLCVYKGLYVWMDFLPPAADDGGRARGLAWLYWLPNPLLPFIWFRVAVPRGHPDILVQEIGEEVGEEEEFSAATRGAPAIQRQPAGPAGQ